MADVIRTRRLLLRRATQADLLPLHRIMNDPAAMRYWSTPPHATLKDTASWLESMIAVDPATSDDFIVTLDGTVIGKLGAWQLPEIGFLIDSAWWGTRLASEALAGFIARRRAIGGDMLTADVDPRNTASLALLARHGFVETGRASGTWHVGGEVCDSVYLALSLSLTRPA